MLLPALNWDVSCPLTVGMLGIQQYTHAYKCIAIHKYVNIRQCLVKNSNEFGCVERRDVAMWALNLP